MDLNEGIFIGRKEDGRYRIVGVSTAAVPDREGETFSVEAIDYDIKKAKETGNYPEFRMFHDARLRIGQVDTMRRAGIFAIDEGWSDTDPFSLACCELIAKDNSGKWRMSRGFYTFEVSGGCPQCGTNLLLGVKHMIAGFRCPHCKSVHATYKEALTGVRFTKTRTFDATITDIPCNTYTGVTVTRSLEDITMKKEVLRKRLLDAGLDETLVEERLSQVTEKQLDMLGDDIPDAEVLKELDLAGGDTEITLDQLAVIVRREVTAALEEVEIEVAVPEQKEYDARLDELEATLKEINDKLGLLLEDDETRLKELLGNAPRSASFRVLRAKCAPGMKKKAADAEDMEDDEEEDDEDEVPPVKKESGAVYLQDGKVAGSLREAVMGGAK